MGPIVADTPDTGRRSAEVAPALARAGDSVDAVVGGGATHGAGQARAGAGPGAPMPDLIPPMLPAAGELTDAGDPDRWAVEFAWEGHRCVAYARPGRVRLLSSTARSVTGSFPELAVLGDQAPPGGMVLDGTVVALDEAGRPSRGPLLRRTATVSPDAALRSEVPVGYVVTDLLFCDGRRTCELPYRRRRAELEALDLAGPKILVPPSFGLDEADLVVRTAERYGLDGLHLKRLDLPYQPGRRTRNWLRVPLRRHRQVLVAGWVPAGAPGGGRERIGAVLLALPEPGGLRYVGRVGIGAADVDARTVLRVPATGTPPLGVPDGIGVDPRWLAPGLVAAVEHRGRTAAGRLTLPSWRGLVAPAEHDDDLATAIDAARRAASAVRPTVALRRPGRGTGHAPGHGPETVVLPRAGAVAAPGTRPASEDGDAPPDARTPGPAGTAAPDRPARDTPPDEGRPARPGAHRAPAPDETVRIRVRDAVPRALVDPVPPATAPDGPWHGPLSRRLEQHFVYNTLNTIASLVRTDPPRARELLLGFADLSRAADRAGEPSIRLDEELAAVRAYLQIERTRFGARLTTELDDPSGAGVDPSSAVPPLSVLAAVRRGVAEEIEPHSAGGAVHVRLDPDAPDGPAARVEVHPAGPAERPARAPLVLLVLPLGVPVV
ncbi:bifunctional non-homologous end joining protein LigD [Pseudonocardia alni]|uniref:DNA ligase (ATP) n=3 Tax=Pseudonocardia TaxID=1847 RepID=A0AA44UKZ9_PSEA5|nr:bifunctional non-homologous end joining protein LigD [Pseudonocardia alni]